VIRSSHHSITATLKELVDLSIAAPDQFREACPITVTSANGATLFWILSGQADVAWVKVNEFYEREDARILDEQQ
jgi:hypothetical protein